MEEFDVAIIGAGFGGLGAAVELVHSGARVVLLEQLRYAGGCASTFLRGGARYESGATLFSGFGKGQLFDRWIDELDLAVHFESTDPLVELRAPGLRFRASPDRATFLRRIAALPNVPKREVHAFFRAQKQVADVLWELFDTPELLPPLRVRTLLTHAKRTPRYLPVLRWVGRPLRAMLNEYGLSGVQAVETYLNAVCQITVQCGIDEVEAPFALGAMDYYFRGTGHIRGGIGVLADGVLQAVGKRGIDVRYSTAVKAMNATKNGWCLRTRRGDVNAQHVLANLTPHALLRLLGAKNPTLQRLAKRVESGWGATMLYRRLRARALSGRSEAHHLELVRNPRHPFVAGNHVFCSLSDAREARTDTGERTLTVSTHIDMNALANSKDPAHLVEEVQRSMRLTIAALAPELDEATTFEMTGSPRTFARFTGRDHGFVGGVPRRAGFGSYAGLFQGAVAPGLHLVGDSVFPGQSTLATALGGKRAATRVLQSLDQRVT